MSLDAREFRNTLGRFATGVVVVTVQNGDGVKGITVNAFMSVSLEPPLVLVSIDRSARTHALLAGSERYGISVLRDDQQAVSNFFASRGQDGLEAEYVHADGFPLVRGALAHLVCRVVERHDVGDHTLFIGRAEHVSYRNGQPLLFYQGGYGHFAPTEADPLLVG